MNRCVTVIFKAILCFLDIYVLQCRTITRQRCYLSWQYPIFSYSRIPQACCKQTHKKNHTWSWMHKEELQLHSSWLSSKIHSPHTVLDFYVNNAVEKNTAVELNPKHIWSKINSSCASPIRTDKLLFALPIPTAHTPAQVININFFFVMLQKRAVMGKNRKAFPTRPSATHTRIQKWEHTHWEFTKASIR